MAPTDGGHRRAPARRPVTPYVTATIFLAWPNVRWSIVTGQVAPGHRRPVRSDGPGGGGMEHGADVVLVGVGTGGEDLALRLLDAGLDGSASSPT